MKVHPKVDEICQKIDAFIAKYPNITFYDKLQEIEDKSGYPKVYFFLAGSLLISAILTLLGGAKLIVDLLGFVYPAYMSFKSMDSGGSDDTQWLTYWVVFSFFSIAENLLSPIIKLIPFYFVFKIVAIIWMYHPQTMGAQKLYEKLLRPLLMPHLKNQSTKKAE